MTISEYLKRLNGIHMAIANDVYPHGAKMTCRACDYEFIASTADCAYYLAHGWPKCCGKTMKTETLKDE